MAVFGEIYSELVGLNPAVSPFLAQKWINRAWRDILDTREWSFLLADGGFNAPPLIQAGAVSITQNSITVVANATAAAAFNAVGFNPPFTLYQFRVGSAGSLYNIVTYDGVNTLTLDRPVLEPTNAAAGYMAYQAYFPPPPQALTGNLLYDFDRWISVKDPVNGIDLDLETDNAWLDWTDPQRTGGNNLAYGIFYYKADVQGNPFYEFWPHPTAGQQFVCKYKRRGLAFSTGMQPLPQMIPEGLIINRALYRNVYPWCISQAGRQPSLAKVNWMPLMIAAEKSYLYDLQMAKLQDENVHLTAIVSPQGPQWFPSSYIQGHDMMRLVGTR